MAEQTSTEKKPATKAATRPAAERDRDEDRPERIDVEREWDERTMGMAPSEKAEQGGDF